MAPDTIPSMEERPTRSPPKEDRWISGRGSEPKPAQPIRWAVVVLVILFAIRVGLKILKEMGIYG